MSRGHASAVCQVAPVMRRVLSYLARDSLRIRDYRSSFQRPSKLNAALASKVVYHAFVSFCMCFVKLNYVPARAPLRSLLPAFIDHPYFVYSFYELVCNLSF